MEREVEGEATGRRGDWENGSEGDNVVVMPNKFTQ